MTFAAGALVSADVAGGALSTGSTEACGLTGGAVSGTAASAEPGSGVGWVLPLPLPCAANQAPPPPSATSATSAATSPPLLRAACGRVFASAPTRVSARAMSVSLACPGPRTREPDAASDVDGRNWGWVRAPGACGENEIGWSLV